MATNKELETQVAELQRQLKVLTDAAGLGVPTSTVEDVTKRADYIPHGSDAHAAFLGLVEVEDLEDAEKNKYIVFVSPTTGKAWRLEDELTITQAFPNQDPDKVVLIVLRQKVNEVESGPPQVPDYAPPLFVPSPNANY